MKTLRFFTVFALAGILFSACTKDPGPSEQNKGKTKPVVTLTQGEASDGVLKFTVAADASASHFGYVVLSGKDNTAPAAYDIVVDEVSGVLDSDVFSYADAASQEVTLECDAFADYQIFAAAITKDGLVGDVVSLDVFVTDTVIPEIAVDEEYGEYLFEPDGSVIHLHFTEPVTYVEGKKITATLYPGYNYVGTLTIEGEEFPAVVVPGLVGEPVGTATAKVTVKDDVVSLDFGDLTPGTFFTISIPEAAFKDAAGNKAPGVTSSFKAPYLYDYKGAIVDGFGVVENNIFGYTANVPFALELPEMTDIEDAEEWIELAIKTPLAAVDEEAKVTTTIKHVDEESGASSTTVTPMAPDQQYKIAEKAILVRPAGTLQPKDVVTIEIPAGLVTDIYGNPNAAVVLGPYKYAYVPVYPVTGNYTVNCPSYPFAAKLEALTDDPAGPYVLYADWFGVFKQWFAPNLYFTVDEPSRTLTCTGQFLFNGQLQSRSCFGTGFTYYDQAKTQMLVFWGGGNSGTDPIVLTYGDDGNLTTISYCDYSVHDANSGDYLGTFRYCDDGTTLTKTEDTEGTVAAAPASATPFAAFSVPQMGFASRK